MSLWLRGNSWVLEFTHKGKKYKRSTGTADKREAQRIAKDIKGDIIHGGSGRKETLLFKRAIDIVYNAKWRHNKDSETPVERLTILADILGHSTTIEDFNHPHTWELLEDGLWRRGISKGTYNRYRAALKTMFTVLRQRGYDTPDIFPMGHLKTPKGKLRYLSLEEEQKFLEVFSETSEIRGFFICLLDTGMRFSELNDLQWKDVDLEKGLLYVWENKGNLPRTIPMTDRVLEILKSRGRPYGLSYPSVRALFLMAKKAIGLESDKEFTIHTLRHTFASRLVQKGVDIYVVKTLMGHSSISMTEIYAHLNNPNLVVAISSLNSN